MRRAWIALGLAAAMLAFGAGLVMAGGGDHPRDAVGIAGAPTIVGKQGGCGMGAQTETFSLTPDDDIPSEADNEAIRVVFKKPCRGPAFASFQTEVSTSSGSFMHGEAFAKCVGTGGFSPHCNVGNTVNGSPGHTFLQNINPASASTHGMFWVWEDLRPGKWQFRVGLGSDGGATAQFRTLVVEVFAAP